MRRLALACILALPACAAAVPPYQPAGAVSHGGQDYPILTRGGAWYVRTPDRPVACRAATTEDCYWSLRAHLQAMSALDNIEG